MLLHSKINREFYGDFAVTASLCAVLVFHLAIQAMLFGEGRSLHQILIPYHRVML